MSTTQVLLLVIGGGVVYIAYLLFIEYKTLTDNVENSHITAVMRSAVQKLPWPFILLALVAGAMMGHCYLQ